MIGGLSAAAALARVGIEGEICEQSETLREGNAIRVLRQLGLEPRLCRFNSRTLFRVQDLNQIVDK